LDAPAGTAEDRSIGELFGRLGDEAKSYARAEAGLYRAIARHRIGKARSGAIALITAALLANAALSVLLIGFSLELALHVGPALGGLIVTAVVLLAAFLLVRWGAPKLSSLGGDPEERAALQAAERMP
jgi:hypothetical protein